MLVDDVLTDSAMMSGVALQFINRLQAVDSSGKLPILYSIDYIAKKLGMPFQNALRPFIADAVILAHSALPPELKLKVASMVRTWVDQKVFTTETASIQSRLNAASATMMVGSNASAHQPIGFPLQQPAMMAGGYGQKVPFSATGIVPIGSMAGLPPGAIPVGAPPAKRPRVDGDSGGSSGANVFQQQPQPMVPAAPAAASTLGRLLAGLKGGPSAAPQQQQQQSSSVASAASSSSSSIPSFFPNVATPASVLPSVGFSAIPLVDAAGRPVLTPEPPLPMPPGSEVRDNLLLPSVMQQHQQGEDGGEPALQPPPVPVFVTVEAEDPYRQDAVATDISSALQSILALSIKNGFAINCLYARQLYRCPECGLRFPKLKDAQIHEKQVHTGDPLILLANKSKLPIISRQWYSQEDAWHRNDCRSGTSGSSGQGTTTSEGDAGSSSSTSNKTEAGNSGPLPGGLPGSAAALSTPGGAAGAGAISPAGSSDSDSDQDVLPAYDPTATCAVCGEGFDRKWDEDLETFVLKGAVSLGGDDGDVYHRSCASTLDPAAGGKKSGAAVGFAR
jgi:hypothetical protein